MYEYIGYVLFSNGLFGAEMAVNLSIGCYHEQALVASLLPPTTPFIHHMTGSPYDFRIVLPILDPSPLAGQSHYSFTFVEAGFSFDTEVPLCTASNFQMCALSEQT